MKLIINKCYGGYGISRTAFLELRRLGVEGALKEADIGEPWGGDSKTIRAEHYDSFGSYIPRDNPHLVEVVERLGSEVASAPLAKLRVVEIPDGVKWELSEYDGIESVEEVNRSW